MLIVTVNGLNQLGRIPVSGWTDMILVPYSVGMGRLLIRIFRATTGTYIYREKRRRCT